MRERWALAPDILHLNHGSFGATPRAVLAEQRNQRDRFEANPTGFIDDEYFEALAGVKGAVATFVGSDPADLAMVPNATSGVSSVVTSMRLSDGDDIVITDHGYNACRNIVDVVAADSGATVTTARITFPGSTPDQAAEALLSRVSPRTRLVVVDHITSPTALVLPVERIVAALEPEVPVLVDGAHAPGMVPLDVGAIGASFYTGNLHKWVCAPKGSAFLAVQAGHRHRIRPPVISHGWNTDWGGAELFHRLFDWTGTFDPSAWLAVPAAIREMSTMHEDGWPGVRAANRSLALGVRDLLCRRIGIEPPAPDEMIGSMAAVPLPRSVPDLDARLRRDGIVALVSEWRGRQVLRVSAQRYNTIDEYDRLADAVLGLLATAS